MCLIKYNYASISAVFAQIAKKIENDSFFENNMKKKTLLKFRQL